MLFLLWCEMKGVVPQPEEQFREIGKKNVETLMSYKKQGKVLAGGAIAGRKGSYAIFDIDSIEELQGMVVRLPMYPFMDVELIPLISWEQTLESIKQFE
jgi:muconolactone D-isomerase